MSAAGTIRACRRLPACAGAACHRRAIRDFVKTHRRRQGDSVVDMGMLEFSIREHLNKTARRRMAVLRPLKIVIGNYPEGRSEEIEALNHPEDANAGTRRIAFGRELFIERDDFMENPPKKFFRLSPGSEVRLRYAYFITCREVVKKRRRRGDRAALHLRLRDQRGNAPDGRKVKATMHWVSAAEAVAAEVSALPIRCSCAPTRMPAISSPSSIRNPAKSSWTRASSLHWPKKTPARRCSSNVRVTSAAIRTRHPIGWCSIARSDCATAGPRSPAARAKARLRFPQAPSSRRSRLG